MKKLLITSTELMMIQFLVPHVKYLSKNGFHVEIACSVVGDRIDDVRAALGGVAKKIHTVRLERSPVSPNNLRGYGDMKRLLEENKYDVVRHDEFIPAEYLPTFSSHAIEMNVHRIPGLAEHLVYFNDDMFLLRPAADTDFFRDGLPCTYGREVPWGFNGNVGIWEHAVANNLGVINAHFPKKDAIAHHGGKFYSKAYRWKDNLRTFALNKLFPDYFTGFQNLHAPAAYLKKTFEEVWAAETELLHITSREKFRAASGVNQWVCLWWQIASGNFTPYVTDNLVTSATDRTIDQLCRCITGQEHAMVCVNDPEENVDFEALAEKLRQAFETILPEKCSFEK